jgi:serine/threonine-protein kinase
VSQRNSIASCPRCHHPVSPGSRFCIDCGADVREAQAQADTLDVEGRTRRRRIPRDEEVVGLLQHATKGEYEILGELGRGGMATVFLAREVALDRKVALKVLSPSLLYGDGMIERFKREARTAGGLSHPHIIPIHAVRETADLLFFVMKFVEGRPLDGVIKDLGPLPIRMAQTILTQVASALHTAHRRQVIHRDIKAANIMLDEEGYAVVTDFGIAKVNTEANLTQTGAAVGTPYYMSPEQFVGSGVGPASDQYALGVVGYEMLAGRVPFLARNLQEVMRAHLVDHPRPIHSFRPDCPPALERAVLRMLAKEPEERFPGMEEVIQAIGAAPLTKDDPIKTQITELARSGKQKRYLPVAGTAARPPSSSQRALPHPSQRPSAERPRQPTPSNGRPVIPKRPGRKQATARWVLTVLFGVGAAAAGWMLVALGSRTSGDARRTEAQAAPTAGAGSWLRLVSRYGDTRLILNGRDTLALGTMPRLIPVPPGLVRLRVERDGCRPAETALEVQAGTTRQLPSFDPACT